MKENQKVYVRAMYLDNKLQNVSVRCETVLLCFIEDVKEYTENEGYLHYYCNDKIILYDGLMKIKRKSRNFYRML